MIKAVIFDIDGTLLDSVDLHARSWVETFGAFGVDAKFEDVRRHIGEGADRLMPAFLPRDTSKEEYTKVGRLRADLFKRKYLPLVRPFPKVRELFQHLRSGGVRLVLGSSCSAQEIKEYKRIAGIADLVDAETTSDEARFSKPAPDIFIRALQQISPVEAHECVVVGDTRFDGEAARKAGIPFIGLLCGGSSAGELAAAGAVRIRKDPEDLLASWTGSLLAGSGCSAQVPI